MLEALLECTDEVNKLLIQRRREEKLIWRKLYATKALLNIDLTKRNNAFRNVMTRLAVRGSNHNMGESQGHHIRLYHKRQLLYSL
jgi:hypothetical protein